MVLEDRQADLLVEIRDAFGGAHLPNSLSKLFPIVEKKGKEKRLAKRLLTVSGLLCYLQKVNHNMCNCKSPVCLC